MICVVQNNRTRAVIIKNVPPARTKQAKCARYDESMIRQPTTYASFVESELVSSSSFSCLIGGSAEDSLELNSSTGSASIFLLLPLGAGSSGVRQYVTVLVTTCRTLTRPGLPLISGSMLVGEKVALHGAALNGVDA